MKSAKIFISYTFLLAFAFQVSAQDIQFSNELKGFKFYGQGKLKDIQLSVSKLEDWTRVFGEDCLSTCDLNENWEVSFLTVGENATSSITENNVERKFMLFPQYENTLWTILMKPKKRVSFSKVSFPETFRKSFGMTSHSKYTYEVYSDSDGLDYWIHAKNTKDGKYKKGDLSSIHYTIPETIESRFHFLIEQKDIID